MIPAPRLLWLITLLLALGLLCIPLPVLATGWWALLASSGLLLLADAWLLTRLPTPVARRRVPTSLPLGVAAKVRLRLSNPGNRSLTLEVFDHHPTTMQSQELPQRANLPADGFSSFTYTATPLMRGELVFRGVQLRLFSPLSFWRHQRWLELEERVRVYPNFAPVAKYTLLATDNRLSQMGIRRHRKRGEGQDFHQLREYRQGDALRQIDWKSSARVRKLISREYQEERDQEIIFLLDCGHRMLARDDELSHFDHSLNAVLLLAYVALRQGDAVGFATFGGDARWLPPFKGQALIHRLLNTLYDIQPNTLAPDYSEAATQLLLRQKKRALIVMITNLRDEDPDDLLPAIQLLRQRHLVLVASMREQALDQDLERPISDFNQALRHAATRDYMNRRNQVMDKLQSHKALYLDVPPQELSVALVNRYLDIKSSGQL
jgi:uncharacterized protein (DUF58 family)